MCSWSHSDSLAGPGQRLCFLFVPECLKIGRLCFLRSLTLLQVVRLELFRSLEVISARNQARVKLKV